ncbi:lambda family phage tail tape measure protein [Buttiauxella sp. BIGb0552]|uniref:phage tail tape measure protein n=1 Tax=Buttiauxella sp. BIGb0552 TaxID=2485120 RepID=UPI001064D666|nr:phage tail tape measure protein [Buttiauxella sp. BIGb0552]TDX14862.1 lambda family phage tail tape measure protein [Buttiauxella sp. BIGb0552]
MSEQIASITLRADVSDLKAANNELDKLSDAAAGAAAGADSLADAAKRVKPATQQGTEGLKEQQNALKGLLENIDPVTKALNRLDEQQASLRGFQTKGFLDNDTFQSYNKILDDTRLKLTDTGEAAARAQAELAATQAAEKQSASLKSLLGSIDPTIRAFNALDEQHALLVSHFESGRINSSQFEHFNGILNETRQRLTTVADVLPEALTKQQLAAQKAGISIGQYNQALRTLPAQFTDIATQLAGGQSPFLILLQQGGQIKDQFGSVGGAISGVGGYLRGLLGLLNPVTLGIGALVLGVGVLATAWYKGTQEASEFNRQLILTGNYSAQTASQLSEMAQKIGGSSNKVAAAAATLSQVVGAGTFKTDQLESVTRAAMAMESATGQSVDATIKNFQKLYANPTKASEDLNSTLHYLTASQYEYISSLERRGDMEGAAEAAAKAYSQAEQQRAQAILNNMGLIEKAIKSATDGWKEFWDAALNAGRPMTEAYQLEQVNKAIAQIYADRQKSGKADLFGEGLINLQKQKADIEFAIKSQEGYAEAQAKSKKINEEGIAAQQVMNKYLDAGTTAAEKRSKAQEELNKQIAANARAAKATQTLPPESRVAKWSQEDIAKARKGIDELYKDPKVAKTPAVRVAAGDRSLDTYNAETLALQAQLKVLQQHTGVNDVISQQRKQQWEIQAKFSVLEDSAKSRTLTKDEQSLLATKDKALAQAEINAGIGDQIASQQKLNSLADQANKFAQQQAAKREEIAAAARGESTREAERASSLQRIKEAYSYNPEAQKKVLAEQRATYQAEDELRDNWIAGAKRGWADYADAATNTYDGVRNVASSTFTGLSDMLTSLMTTGNASIKEFGKSMLKMILEVTNRLMVAYAVQAAMGWISGSSNPQGGGVGSPDFVGPVRNAKGGVYQSAGLHQYANGVYDSPQHFTFQGATKFAKGGVFGEAGPEAIMPLTRDSAGRLGVKAHGGGGMAPVINTTINVDAGGSATAHTSSTGDAMGRALADDMQNAALQVVQKHLKPGGMIYNFSKGR